MRTYLTNPVRQQFPRRSRSPARFAWGCAVFPVWKFALLLVLATSGSSFAATLKVPVDHSTIQAAVDAAVDGDTVLVAPGIYNENLLIAGKAITLASHFFTSGDHSYIDSTVIDGGGGSSGIEIAATVGPGMRIIGLTVRNASNGITPYAKFEFLNGHITANGDGVDYETGSGGLIADSLIDFNTDDGLDFDGSVDIIVERCIIENNKNDGVEERFHKHDGPILNVVIRDNVIRNNGGTKSGNGIQLIASPNSTGTNRVLRIERNLIVDNAQAGIGMMCCGETREDFQGASLVEPIYIINNVFSGNNHGITGGNNTVVVNNIFTRTTEIALKRVNGSSIAAYNLFFNNGSNVSDSNIDWETTLTSDPELSSEYKLADSSPAVDAGTKEFIWQGQKIVDLSPSEFYGTAPDLGKYQLQKIQDSTLVPER